MKVLHRVGGRSMVGHVLAATRAVDPSRVVAVVGHQREQVGEHVRSLVPEAVLAVQETQEGTGHAVRVAVDALGGEVRGTVVVLTADTPLLRGESLAAFVAERIATFKVPTRWFVTDEPLPKGATGKILKREIKDNILASG